MDKIFIGVPLLNRLDLLKKAVATYDHPHELFVVNNNTVDDALDAELAQWKEEAGFDVVSPRFNLGCSASWNRIIMEAMSRGYEYCYIGSNDTTLEPGALATFAGMEKKEDEGIWLANGMNFFCIRIANIPKIGWFDENFYPAYFEDNDYVYRCKMAGLLEVGCGPAEREFNGRTLPAIHMHHLGSQTVASDPVYAAGNSATFGQWNRTHFMMKWGGPPGQETHKTPYGRADKDHRWWGDPGGSIAHRDWDNPKRKA